MERFFNRDHARTNSLLALLLLLVAGCGTKQFSPAGRELMHPLQTALSSKNKEWLDATEKKIVAQHDAKTVSDSEFASFEKIIKQARAGDWKEAHRATVGLIDLQRPSSVDVAQVSSKKRIHTKDEKPVGTPKK